MICKTDKIYVAGHTGLVGSAVWNKLIEKGFTNLIGKTHQELDLTIQQQVKEFFDKEKPDIVILCAAKVGGIIGNALHKADFITENILIETNIISESYKHNIKKLIFLGSTCIYPKNINYNIMESDLLSGELEYTNESFSVAKIAGLKMCEAYNLQYGTNYISVMPTNLYGINDNFDLINGHAVPSMIRKIHLAKLLFENKIKEIELDLQKRPINGLTLKDLGINKDKLVLWGTGTPLREFMYSDDAADAIVYILENVDFKDIIKINEYSDYNKCKLDIGNVKNTHINISVNEEYTIKELSEIISKIIGYKGKIEFDNTKPDGIKRKQCNTNRLKSSGWKPKYSLIEGLEKIYKWYLTTI